jgi:hypothetical protein
LKKVEKLIVRGAVKVVVFSGVCTTQGEATSRDPGVDGRIIWK